MRRGRAIVCATVLEILGEPLVLLVTVASVAIAALAPAMHYHQFGDPSRMARDAGLSALLLGGAATAFSGTVRTFRREMETGTAQAALAHSVSRTAFFLWKFAGCAVSYALFAAIMSLVALIVVRGAEIGGAIAAEKGDVARLWGPSLAFAVAVAVVPLVASAALNRFARFRFVLVANVISLVVAAIGAMYNFDPALAGRLVPAFMLAASPALVIVAAAAAFAVRFKANAASSLVAIVAACMLPLLGNYCLSDALADGGRVPWMYIVAALAALLPAIVAPLAVGVAFINGQDVQ